MVKLTVDRVPARYSGPETILVDDADAAAIELLRSAGCSLSLNADCYPALNGVPLHRIFFPRLPRGWVADHIDDDPLNAQRSNFQILTVGENTRKAAGLSPFPQPAERRIYFNKTTQRWCVQTPMPKELGLGGGRPTRTFAKEHEAEAHWARYCLLYAAHRELIVTQLEKSARLQAYHFDLNHIAVPRTVDVIKKRIAPTIPRPTMSATKKRVMELKRELKRKELEAQRLVLEAKLADLERRQKAAGRDIES
jgi:hypothetical protein